MSEKITREDVAHVAQLARLSVDDDELEMFTSQLAAVLEHAADVEALDLSEVPPTAHPLAIDTPLRPDLVGPTLTAAQALAAAPAVEANQFKVPPILGEAP